jgi:hypothetical protein
MRTPPRHRAHPGAIVNINRSCRCPIRPAVRGHRERRDMCTPSVAQHHPTTEPTTHRRCPSPLRSVVWSPDTAPTDASIKRASL